MKALDCLGRQRRPVNLDQAAANNWCGNDCAFSQFLLEDAERDEYGVNALGDCRGWLQAVLATLRDRAWIEKKMIDYELKWAWFDIVETLRKLFLTGLAVLLGQGTMEQLVLSVLLAAAMLAITATLRPYKNLEDDSLSIICQSAVVADLAVAIQLHSMRAGFALERLNLAIVHQTDRAFYVQQLRVLKGRQDVAEDTLALLLIVVAALPFLIAIAVLFLIQHRMIEGSIFRVLDIND